MWKGISMLLVKLPRITDSHENEHGLPSVFLHQSVVFFQLFCCGSVIVKLSGLPCVIHIEYEE